MGTDGYYVAINATNSRYLTSNEHIKHHKINNLRFLTINSKT